MAPQAVLQHFLIQFIKEIALEEAGGSPAFPGAFPNTIHEGGRSGGGWWLFGLSWSIS